MQKIRKISSLVAQGKTLVSDGAWGTMLMSKGLKAGECPEAWNVTHRQEVLDIAMSYIEAGSDIIQTNTFGASPIRLSHFGLEDMARELNEAGAAIAREAAGPDHLVLGSIGPTGKILIMGEVVGEELFETFSVQAVGLEAGGVDALCLETFTAIDEAIIAIRAASMNTDLEIACTFTFEKMTDGTYHTFMGHSVKEVVNALRGEGVDIIGTNCGTRIDGMIDIVREIRAVEPDLPILVHSNAGMPSVEDGSILYPDTPELMASRIPELIRAGANIIGGCCGTTPEHIRAMARAIRTAN